MANEDYPATRVIWFSAEVEVSARMACGREIRVKGPAEFVHALHRDAKRLAAVHWNTCQENHEFLFGCALLDLDERVRSKGYWKEVKRG